MYRKKAEKNNKKTKSVPRPRRHYHGQHHCHNHHLNSFVKHIPILIIPIYPYLIYMYVFGALSTLKLT